MDQPDLNGQRGVRTERNQRLYRNNRGSTYLNRNNRNYNSDRVACATAAAPDSTTIQNFDDKRSSISNFSCQPDTTSTTLPLSEGRNASSACVNQSNLSPYASTYQPKNNQKSTAEYDSHKHYSGNTYQNIQGSAMNRKKHRNAQNVNESMDQSASNDTTPDPPEGELQNESVHKKQIHKYNKNSANDRESYQGAEHETRTNPQRGKIVGGRYVRKHASNPIPHSQSYNSFENIANSEQSFNSQHQPSFPSRDFNQSSKNQQRRTFYDLDYNRDYAYENSHNFGGGSRRKANSNPRRYEKISSSTDVYHYATVPDEPQKKALPTLAVFNKESRSSKLSRYKEDGANQRELLIQHLNKGECECLVCCEQIRAKDQTWHCLSCYHVFHLRCIRKWARSPAAVVEDGGWRCPACQSLTSKVPYDYFCFCGKQKNPDVNYHITPHSCGEICGRKRPDCSHLCKDLCHPGPCPPCLIVVQKSCACGKTFKTTTCKQSVEETCNSICDKLLNCGVHSCKSLCHSGECLPCEDTVVQECYCGKDTQTVPCSQESSKIKYYSCTKICDKLLHCGHHNCNSACHFGPCDLCTLSTEVIKSCPCGKSSLEELITAGQAVRRISCQDPVPVCGEKCDKILFCGPKDNPHKCQSSCHTGECPPCLLSTSRKCRCGAFTKEFNCAEISPAFVYTCEKRCNRRKDCGRHKCLNNCCIYIEHKCDLICNKKLTCGNHQCPEVCHAGNCPACWNVSFDELRCHCGESVLYPPIHCGTKPPECSKPCIRNHPCGHDVKHSCHSDDICPPCTSLTVKWCYGHHKQCGSVMCFIDAVSCGMPCHKPLLCGKHECQITCHAGPCLKGEEKCAQVCAIPRISCSHPCGNPCHEGTCLDTPCRAQVMLTCPCGHRSETTTCYDSTKSYRLMSASVLASKMQEIKDGQSVNLNDVLGRKSKSSKLQCNEECAVIERNKRLAVALQIHNPDLSCSPGPPSYSEFLKTEAKKSLTFVADIYDKLTDLVQLAKESKQKCRSYAFPAMKRDHRRVVHELAEFFGCETQSYDEEPKKNVVVTAHKTKCWLPFVSIMTVVQRDMGFRKGPTPILAQREPKISSGANNIANNQKKKIDYFDFKE